MKNKTIGIYLITERATRRDVYVGQGIVYDRWKKHRSKYPEDRFDYRILLECPRCDLNFWEQHYIRVLKTHWTEGGENQNWGGQFWPRPEEPLSPATRAKISASKKGSVSPNKGKTRSEEARAKQTEAMKGKVFSEEHKAKLRGKTPANKGMPMSEEQKAKQSAAQKGRVRGPMSEEQKAKLRGKGRPKSEEQKAKIAATLKARAALKRAAKAMAPVDELLGPDCPSATTDNLTQ